MESWFAVWTRSRHEHLVCKELAAKQIEAFLPTFTQLSRWKDRTKRIEWPLFPGYCFARFNPSCSLSVAQCTGVVAVLSDGIHPIPVPDPEIEALQRVVHSGLVYDPCPLIKVGTTVRVIGGPLCGVVGRLVRKGPQDHLMLAVDILNSAARVQVSASDTRPV
jgi:transcription termination/antitermination protein NusG